MEPNAGSPIIMFAHLDKLIAEGYAVLDSRKTSGHRLLYDQVDSLLYHKWALNCIGFLAKDAPEHGAQTKEVHKPNVKAMTNP